VVPDPTLSAAIAEAYASATEIVYATLELWHPAFTDPIRVVSDHVALDARLEAGAPRDAGDLVTFTAYAFRLVPPDQTSEAVPQATLEIDNVAGEILDQVTLAAESGEPITVIFRQFLQGELDLGPSNDPPMELTIQSISATAFRVRAVMGFGDLLNRKFPAREYDLEQFPGLQP
jgi:hypothetical protein